MAQLFNLKFFLYLCWLGVGSSPQFSSRETLYANFEKQNLKNNLKIVRTITNTKKVPKMFVLNGQKWQGEN